MGIDDSIFYDEKKIALVPMGFCYPGKGKTGDLPPRVECAKKWHDPVMKGIKEQQLILLIGQYAQRYYLPGNPKKNLTETVLHYEDYLPNLFPLPHPSPRNRFWLTKNKWFESGVLPKLKDLVKEALIE